MTVDEAIRANRREYYAANRERILALAKANREKNREQRLAKRKLYRERNKEKIRAINRACYERTREKRIAYHRERRLRLKGIDPRQVALSSPGAEVAGSGSLCRGLHCTTVQQAMQHGCSP